MIKYLYGRLLHCFLVFEFTAFYTLLDCFQLREKHDTTVTNEILFPHSLPARPWHMNGRSSNKSVSWAYERHWQSSNESGVRATGQVIGSTGAGSTYSSSFGVLGILQGLYFITNFPLFPVGARVCRYHIFISLEFKGFLDVLRGVYTWVGCWNGHGLVGLAWIWGVVEEWDGGGEGEREWVIRRVRR